MVSALATFCGCGGSTEDAAVVDDAGDETITEGGDESGTETGDMDTGTVDDTGTTPTDGDVDSGTTPTDGDVDSGTTPTDTGTTPADTGTTPTDSGTVTDSGSDTSTTVDTGPEIGPGTGTCTTVAITTAGYTDTHVRQGAGPIAIKVTGTGLTGTTSVSFGSVVCTAVVATATQVTANCTIPHGATLGATNISLNGGAIATCLSGATIDKITVNAATGSDTNVGSSTKPYKSVKQGLSVAASGDTVDVKAGTYSTAATGETWVTTVGASPFGAGITANVAAGVTIEGDTAGGTKLVGTGGPGGSTTTALLLAGAATLKDLNLDNFKWGVAASSGNVSLTNVVVTNSSREGVIGQAGAGGALNLTLSAAAAGSGATLSKCLLQGNDVGIRLSGAGTKATLTNCDVDTNDSGGGVVLNGASLTTSASRFSKNGVGTAAGVTTLFGAQRLGLYVEGTSALTMTGGNVTQSYDYGILALGASSLTLTNLSVTSNGKGAGFGGANSGIVATAPGGPGSTPAKGKLDITGGDVSGNGATGLSVGSAWDTNITGTTFTFNQTIGISVQSAGSFSAKGVTVSTNTGFQVSVTDGANNAPKIEFVANGANVTKIFRGVDSTLGTDALVNDTRGNLGAVDPAHLISFAASTLFQSGTMTAKLYTGTANFNNAGGTQLVFHIQGTNRQIEVK
ncbi:MAG: beta strand repeat-containing protein [Polyangiales bacterium]